MKQLIPLLLCAALLAGAAGCGTDEQAQRAAANAAQKRKAADKARAAADKAQAAADDCQRVLGPLLRKTKALGSRLDVGLNYDRYSSNASDLKVAYDSSDFTSLGANSAVCLSNVGVPLEKGVNRYLEAYRIWNKCFEDTDCSNDSIDGKLQKKWFQAGNVVNLAGSQLDDLKQAAEDARTEAKNAAERARAPR